MNNQCQNVHRANKLFYYCRELLLDEIIHCASLLTQDERSKPKQAEQDASPAENKQFVQKSFLWVSSDCVAVIMMLYSYSIADLSRFPDNSMYLSMGC